MNTCKTCKWFRTAAPAPLGSMPTVGRCMIAPPPGALAMADGKMIIQPVHCVVEASDFCKQHELKIAVAGRAQ